MRVVIVSVAALAVLGGLALVASRLAGTFEQLRAVAEVQPAAVTASAARPENAPAPRGEAMKRGAGVGEPPPAELSADAHTPAGNGGDEHLLRMLAADPEFARAADELLNDPDPQTRDEARQLLRDLGVP